MARSCRHPWSTHGGAPLLVALLVVVGSVASGIGTTPLAGAQETGTSPDATSGKGTAAEAYREQAAELAKSTARLKDLANDITKVEATLVQVNTDLAAKRTALDTIRAQIQELRDTMRERAAAMYRQATSPQLAITSIRRVQDLSSGTHYAETTSTADQGALRALEPQEAKLAVEVKTLQDQHDQMTNQRDDLVRTRDQMQITTDQLRQRLFDAGTITVIGEATLTPEAVTQWFERRGASYRLAGGMTIKELIGLYFEEGALEHVRPELAFAQAIIETGSFGHAADSNFAGIGACDSCTGQIPFTSPRDGVRGQIQMLRNYADPASRAVNLANPPSAPIYGSDPGRAAASYDSFFAKGVAPTWNLMGNGNWATDPGYAPKVLSIYFEMTATAEPRA